MAGITVTNITNTTATIHVEGTSHSNIRYYSLTLNGVEKALGSIPASTSGDNFNIAVSGLTANTTYSVVYNYGTTTSYGYSYTTSFTTTGSVTYSLTIQPYSNSGVSYVYGYWSDTGTWQYAFKSSPISHTFTSSGGYFYVDQVGYDTNYTYPVYVDFSSTLIDSSGSFVAHKILANSTSGRTAYFTCTYAQTYTITVRSADTTMGTVAGGGTGTSGNSTYLLASANTGYAFDHWEKDGSYYSSSYYISSLEYNSTNAGTYIAYFTSTIVTGETIELVLQSATSTSLSIKAQMMYSRGYDRWVQLRIGTSVVASANISAGSTYCTFTLSSLNTGQVQPQGYTYNAIARYNSTSGQQVGATVNDLTAYTNYFTTWTLVGAGAISSGYPAINLTASAWNIMNAYLSDKALYRHGTTFTPPSIADGIISAYAYNRMATTLNSITSASISTVSSGSILSATKLNYIPTYINEDDNTYY